LKLKIDSTLAAKPK